MIEIWAYLVPILLADVLNPVLFAFLIYAAGTQRPVLNSSFMLLGHTLAYFFAGIGLYFGLDKISELLANPGNIDYAISMIIGVLLLWVVFALSKSTKKKEPEEDGTLTPMSAFGLGAVLNFIGIPFALPYFAGIDRILKADFTFFESVSVLGGYNLLYALPFMIVPVMIAVSGESSKAFLGRINNLLERGSDILMPILLVVIGLGLIADAVVYFITGQGLL